MKDEGEVLKIACSIQQGQCKTKNMMGNLLQALNTKYQICLFFS
jgi:hypothetical protein